MVIIIRGGVGASVAWMHGDGISAEEAYKLHGDAARGT